MRKRLALALLILLGFEPRPTTLNSEQVVWAKDNKYFDAW